MFKLSIIHTERCTFRLFNLCKMYIHDTKITESRFRKHTLQEYLGISFQQAVSLIRSNPFLQSIDLQRLKDTINMLKLAKFDCQDIYKYPLLLTLHSNTVQHNIKYLQEAGFTYISPQILLRFRVIVKKPISLLKAHNVISKETDVPNQLYSFLTPKIDNILNLDKFTDDDNLIHIHEIMLKQYLVWRLDTNMSEIERIFKIYDNFKYKSFEILSNMINYLKKEIKFDNERLLHHGYLLLNGSCFVEKTIKHFPKLADVDIKVVLKKHPKLISVPYENIAKVDSYLKDFEISNEAIQKCFGIYTLSPETVLYRLNELKNIAEFSVLRKHPRFVRLIFGQNKAKLRLEHLQRLNIKCASINVLCASDRVFEKYVLEGTDRIRGADLIKYICDELLLSKNVVKTRLSHNPHWCHVPLVTVQDTLYYLYEQGFSKNDIGHLPVILLYPRKQIERGFQILAATVENLQLNMKEKINLCLYFIEKQHYFSGNGIWDNDTVNAI